MSEDKCVNDCNTPIPDGGTWGYCDNCWNYVCVSSTLEKKDVVKEAMSETKIQKDIKTLHELEKLIRRLYGEECDVYDEGCPTCEAWKFVTELSQLTLESWEVKGE